MGERVQSLPSFTAAYTLPVKGSVKVVVIAQTLLFSSSLFTRLTVPGISLPAASSSRTPSALWLVVSWKTTRLLVAQASVTDWKLSTAAGSFFSGRIICFTLFTAPITAFLSGLSGPALGTKYSAAQIIANASSTISATRSARPPPSRSSSSSSYSFSSATGRRMKDCRSASWPNASACPSPS